MTKFWPLLFNLFKKKSRSVYMVVGLQLIGAIIAVVNLLFHQTYQVAAPAGFMGTFGFLAGLILFILLARNTEQVWTSNTYRLLPTTDFKLYLANLCSTALSFLYFLLIQVLLLGLSSLTLLNQLGDINLSASSWTYFVSGVITLLALVLYGWALISLIHLLGRTISTWLPVVRSRFIITVFYIIVAMIVLKIMSLAGDLLEKLLVPLYSGQMATGVTASMYSLSGVCAVLIIVFSAINIFLLKNRVEPNQTA
ncbi:ABC transporter permease [Loigolactobacillus jiayinensis]|uniref:ABC transporter permease n=1 Tax=Loigolactobacillus jiayinensis TaxID=2486016 RepID=A0ABW1RGE4_9LACO|nr:ABC transporter permease [Loigolactobacillus jiayinensis]